MSRSNSIGRITAAWAGWLLGAAGWALSNQLSVYLVDLDCAHVSPVAMVAIGLGGALVAIAGALLSLGVWRRGKADPDGAAFIGVTGAMAGGLFLLAILFQTCSALIIPPCHA